MTGDFFKYEEKIRAVGEAALFTETLQGELPPDALREQSFGVVDPVLVHQIGVPDAVMLVDDIRQLVEGYPGGDRHVLDG